jgi:hypothetical protein
MENVNEMPLPPVETPVSGEVQQPPKQSFNKQWVVVGIIALFVVALLGAVAWRVFYTRPTALVNELVSQEELLVTENGEPTAPTGAIAPIFDLSEERAIEATAVWENPFGSEPCFVSGKNTCQYAFHGGKVQENILNIYSLVLPKNQEQQDLFFLFSRMLVARGSVFEAYQPILATGEPQPYYGFIDRVYTAGLENSLNPAFIFTVYDQIFLISKLDEWKTDQVFDLLPPEKLTTVLAKNLADPSAMTGTPLGQSIQGKEWTPEAKALVYTLGTMIHSEVLTRMLETPGQFEQRYYEIFAPSRLRGEVALQYASVPLTPEQVFSLTEPVPQGYDYVICKAQKAHLCLQGSGTAECSPFIIFDNYCRSLTNIP